MALVLTGNSLLIIFLDRVIETDPDGCKTHLTLQSSYQTVVQTPVIKNNYGSYVATHKPLFQRSVTRHGVDRSPL